MAKIKLQGISLRYDGIAAKDTQMKNGGITM